jgi:YjbR
MATARDLRRIAMSLDGTVEAPHFDRVAFKVARIYATLAADELTANLMLAPDEQQLKCTVAPDAFAPVPNKWGQRGATTVTLARVSVDELHDALAMAWRRALPVTRAKRPPRGGAE